MYYNVKKKSNIFKIFISFLLIMNFVVLFVFVDLKITENNKILSSYSVKKLGLTNENDDFEIKTEEEFSKTIKNATSCVVGISKLEKVGTSIFLKDVKPLIGVGSGVVVSENGFILTNEHVSGGKYSNCYITFENGVSYNGSVVWADANIDLSIVKISCSDLNYLELADSDKIFLGEDVYAIGNPVGFEFQRTVTKGIVSGINRTLKLENLQNPEENVYMEDLIQTDSTINEGNSGGPLINLKGQVIGINSIKLNEVDGMGFAVPVNIIKPILSELLKNGKFDEAYLGIFGYDTEVLPYLDKNLRFENGIYIAKINSDGALINTKIKEGDIILAIDDYEIDRMNDLKEYIYSKKPGDEIILKLKRNNQNFYEKIVLKNKI